MGDRYARYLFWHQTIEDGKARRNTIRVKREKRCGSEGGCGLGKNEGFEPFKALAH